MKVKTKYNTDLRKLTTETCTLSCKKRIASLCSMQDTGCLGLVHGDDVGWEVGRGFMFGSSCTPVADSCQCMAKPIQYCKVKVKIKIKKNK